METHGSDRRMTNVYVFMNVLTSLWLLFCSKSIVITAVYVATRCIVEETTKLQRQGERINIVDPNLEHFVHH